MCIAFMVVFLTFFTLVYFNFDLKQTVGVSFLSGVITIIVVEFYYLFKKK